MPYAYLAFPCVLREHKPVELAQDLEDLTWLV